MALRSILWLLPALMLLVKALPSKEHFKVAEELLPGVSSIPKDFLPEMYAGQLELHDHQPNDGKLFFWRFSEKKENTSDTIVLWLNGGPGCSSIDGVFLELGPFRVDETGKLYVNDGSWHTKADILFIDQPVGTGFSIGGPFKSYHDNLEAVSEDFIAFMINYFTVFPEDRAKKLILAGESFAGQYIPYFAHSMLEYNKNSENGVPFFNLDRLLIGNGWIAPDQQSLSYVPFLMKKGILSRKHDNLHVILQQQEKCQNAINSGSPNFQSEQCDKILNILLELLLDRKAPVNEQCINIYDYRLRASYPGCGMDWPPDLPNIAKFFDIEGVLDALHIDSTQVSRWVECNGDILDILGSPSSKPSIHLFPDLLESGLEIVLFNGDKDIVCNNLGIEAIIRDLTWAGSTGFTENVKQYDWVDENRDTQVRTPVGIIQKDRGLTFISVYNASHMVPYNIGRVGAGLIDIARNRAKIVQDKSETADMNSGTMISYSHGKGTHDHNSSNGSTADLKGRGRFGALAFMVLASLSLTMVSVVVYYILRDQDKPPILIGMFGAQPLGQGDFTDNIELGTYVPEPGTCVPEPREQWYKKFGSRKGAYSKLPQPHEAAT
ncbi:HDL335Wp [Eremothecium sinecaudum]|uniref:Pheromone-processing carboxypeptidase KEX1 n=1 Tax=Eremothecium sinecaudum TaxID=45286 RepID=A0A0X8HS32_9SACH|nr:HDL335Wp [Eremothecium sinecaudum]AMD20409.1 HDL335Wp [Eremothecium sinecaudum]